MLLELSVRDLALLEALDLSLATGLNAISGETGAGKSLFVGALELLRGETPKGGTAQWIRSGADEARVEARFELVGADAIAACRAALEREVPAIAEAWAEDAGKERAELLLGRSLSAQGRSRAHVEQRPVPLRALRALAPHLIEIHGQNDHQRLLAAEEQRRLLDRYGGLEADVRRYEKARAAHRELVRRRERLDERRAERSNRADLLRFQLEELRALELSSGETAALRDERELLRGATELRTELGRCVDALSEAEDSALDRLRAALRVAESWSERLPRLAAAAEDLASAEVHASEAAQALASVVDEAHDDPARLEEVEARLHEIERLAAKHRRDEAGLLELAREQEAELVALEHADEDRARLDEEIEATRTELGRAARALRKKRRALLPRLKRDVEATLAALGLAKASFDVDLGRLEGDGADDGARADEVVFRLAANPGEPPGPLSRVASGGETARIMLALQSVLQSTHGSDGRTLVFDEIDAGVGGRLGPEVAAQLQRLAATAQVLCVTHIPAIAAAAGLHLATFKEVRKGRTRTEIRPLAGDARVREVADMIAGGADHETARAEARRLLAESAV